MREEIMGLGLVLKKLNNFSKKTFEDRLLIQKKIYCLQMVGLDLGYRFNWYLHGPYSPELTSASFRIIDHGEDFLAGYELDDSVSPYLAKVEGLASHHKRIEIGLSESDWLELLTSIDYLNRYGWMKPKSKDTIRKVLKSEKPKYRDTQFEAAWETLKSIEVA